ncbi:MAG: putative Outer Membrane Protein, partial [Gammaproteobacteria bacterium]|nr:putative Outer Membrane Protein [Gammaproteobacteria bacterium]
LSDDRGVWLNAEHISLRWSPLSLLARHILVDSLHVGLLDIERAPVTKPDDKPSSEFTFPHSDITQLAVDTLQLGPDLAGTATSLVVKGSAHWRSLRDAMTSLVAQRTGGVGNYDLQLRFNADRMDATLKLQEPANGPLENLLQVPGLGDLSVFAQLTGPRTAEHIQLTLDAGALRGRVQGTLNLLAVSADLDYTLTASAMTPRPGLSWQSVDLQGRWHGTASAPNADGHLLIKKLLIPGGTELADLDANLTATGGMLTTRATLTGLVIPGSQPKLFQDSPLTLDASVNMSDPKRPVELKATHRLFALQGHATTVDEIAAQLDLRLPDVTPFAALGGQKVRGTATVKAQITHDTKSTRLTADADANIDGGNESWAGLVRGGNTRLQVTGAMTADKFSIDKLQLTGRAISLAANGTAARSATQDLDLRLEAALSDLTKLSPSVVGTLKLSGKVQGPSNSLSTVGDLTTTVSIHGSPKGTVSASVRADGLPKEPRGTVEAHGDLDGAPLHLNVSLEREKGDVVHAVIHHADWKSARIQGDLTSGADIAQARGNLRLGMSQLSDLNRLLGSTLQGSISGEAALTPVSGRTQAKINLEAHNVVAGGVTTNGKLTATGTMDALDVHLDAQSPAVGGEPASVTAATRLNVSKSELQLASLEAKYHGQTVRLLSPATVSFADGLSIGDLKLGAQQAILEIDGRISPTLDMRASLKQVKPELVNAFVPGLLAAGTIQADAQVQGSTSAPTGKLHLEAMGIRGANDAARGLPAVDMHANALLLGNTAKVDAKLTAGSASNLTLTGDAPFAADGALNLKLGGTLDIGLLNPLVEASGRHVTGAVTIDTTVTGAAANPEIGGTVKLANGSVRDYTQGVNLTDITGQFAGSHGTLQIQTLTAKAAPGTVSITGTIGVLQPHIPVDLKLMAKNAQPIANNIITANLNADMHIGGTAREQLEIEGELYVNRATIEIPSGFPPDVAVLDVRRPGKGPPPKPEKQLVITLNVAVDAPRQILVKGRGLDSEMGGQIKIGGTTDVPIVSGEFELQKGSFTLGSSQLNFSSGTVTFNGQGLKKKIDPTLDFEAQTVAADVTATVKITGLADSPKIELSSTPDLPQDEIMARLLFGESAAQLTALQVVQIGAALASLGGGGGGLNPLTKLQKTLGLDRLTVGSDATNGGTGANSQTNNGYSVEAGRYVSSRVFVAVKESTTGQTHVAVDVDLTKHLKLQTRLGSGGTSTNQGTTPENDQGSSIGLAYQFEY